MRGAARPNGSGKSTLLLHLNGILPEKLSGNGAVKILGEPVGVKNIETIRRQVGWCFKTGRSALLSDGAGGRGIRPRSNWVWRKRKWRARVEKSLAQAGLAGFGRRATHHLSHGEKRRVCLAGVLACEPAILILDEPTSDLDPRGAANSRRCSGRFPRPS